MKIIFLDFDGVLNCEDWYRRQFEETKNDLELSEYPYIEFDPEIIQRLNYIINETGAKVVVSSSWRAGRSVEELQIILNRVGFSGEIIDKTNHLDFINGYCIPRGCEIEHWLEQKGQFQRINWSFEEQIRRVEEQIRRVEEAKVKNYIILDDDSDMLYNQREHFICTSGYYGLTKEKTEKAITILNTPLEKLYYPTLSL
jgi:hypothetical protein